MGLGRIRRAHVVAIVLAVVLNLSLAAVGLRLYVFPDTDARVQSDVVFVLGPPTPTRLAIATKMAAAGLTSTIVVSVPANGNYEAAHLGICTKPQPFTVYCVTPDPFTTQGEARMLRDLSAEHGWTSATVITFTPHILRARVLMERCFTGDLHMVADRAPLPLARWLYEMVYQTSAFAKVFAEPSC